MYVCNSFAGNLNGCETKLSGKAEIPNLSDENDAEDVDVSQSGGLVFK